jgi:DNA-directed RNA polymerase specialized sigma24 family protein
MPARKHAAGTSLRHFAGARNTHLDHRARFPAGQDRAPLVGHAAAPRNPAMPGAPLTLRPEVRATARGVPAVRRRRSSLADRKELFSMSDINARLAARMGAAVAALPESEQTVFLLHAIDEQDYATVAARLGIGVDQVELLLASALFLLARHLAGDRPDEGPLGNDA